MHRDRLLYAFLASCALASPASAGPESIFADDFEDGSGCAWGVAGPDLCGLFAHSGLELYRLDPNTFEVLPVGPFNTGGPAMNDIAIDKNDRMFGVSPAKLWSIDRTSGAATEISPFDGSTDSLTSLSFVPLNGADPNSAERLVAIGSSGNVYEVNSLTGATTLLGNLGLASGSQIRSGGDLVSVRGLGTFATVTVGDTATEPDYLATIHTTTWAATLVGALSTGFDKVFGLGYWGGRMLGFVDDGSGAGTGRIIDIDTATGVGTLTEPTVERWFGAAVATDAPVGP